MKALKSKVETNALLWATTVKCHGVLEPNGGPETGRASEILSGGLQGQNIFIILKKYLPFHSDSLRSVEWS